MSIINNSFDDFTGTHLKIWHMEKEFFYENLSEICSFDLHLPVTNFEILTRIPQNGEYYDGNSPVHRGVEGLKVEEIRDFVYPQVTQCPEAKDYNCYMLICKRVCKTNEIENVHIPVCIKKDNDNIKKDIKI